jgi:hypothetical protein
MNNKITSSTCTSKRVRPVTPLSALAGVHFIRIFPLLVALFISGAVNIISGSWFEPLRQTTFSGAQEDSRPAAGPLTNGANHSGTIAPGPNTETWTFQASVNDFINLSAGEVPVAGPDPAFYPRIQLLAPNSAVVTTNTDTNVAGIGVRAPQSGTYTVVISNNFPNSQTAPAGYILRFSKTPGPYTVSAGDEGGALTNGSNHQAMISLGDFDTWTFDATFNDSISLSAAEVVIPGPNPGFYPRLILLRPDGATVTTDTDTNVAAIGVRAPVTGTYTVVVSNNFADDQEGDAGYVLRYAKTPGPYTISAGDDGGALTNGANHAGTIPLGDFDTWTFEATASDSLSVSLSEVFQAGPNPQFYPRVTVVRPDGATLFTDTDTDVAGGIAIRPPLTGTYLVLVSNNFPDDQIGVVDYTLVYAKTAGPYTISPGDEGGPLTNGANHAGVIPRGDFDTWTFAATANENVSLSVSEDFVAGPSPGFYPRITVIRSDGTTVFSDTDTDVAGSLGFRAPTTGTYLVIVSNNFPDDQIGAVNYTLAYAKTTGPYTISPGDEGGALTNGANHVAAIPRGDFDTWTFNAVFNESISLSLAEVFVDGPNPGYYPRITLVRPDGAVVATDTDTNVAGIGVRAPMTGPYLVLVSNNFGDDQIGTVNYTLRYAKTAGPYTISPGDEGGALTNGSRHPGAIPLGDFDTWTFDATFNDNISLSLAEVIVPGPNPGFNPRVSLIRPDGETVFSVTDSNVAINGVRAPVTGTYVVIVSNNFADDQIGVVDYVLEFAKTPGPYRISVTDEGGPLTVGTRNGSISLGDFDTYIFHAAANNTVTFNLNEVVVPGPNPGFYPLLELVRPDGQVLATNSGTNAAQINTQVPSTGVYTVFVSNNFADDQIGTVDYTLNFTGPVQPTLSIGSVNLDEGDNGTTNFSFTATLSGAVTQAVNFNYATTDGSAVAGSDYIAVTPTQATIAAGALTQTVPVAVNGDLAVEPNETFFVNLSGVLVVNVSGPQGTGTIVNDDTQTAPSPTPSPGSASVSGVVTYGTAPAGQAVKFVPGVLLTGAGATGVNATTNAFGTYSLGGFSSGGYTVTPTKSGDVNGISGLDAARVAQHVAGLTVLTPNQQIAGDSTNNGSLSGLDAARIAQTAAGIANSGIAGQWKFVPGSRSYASVTGSLSGENYEAILVGDVTGNWAPTAGGARPGNGSGLESESVAGSGSELSQPKDFEADGHGASGGGEIGLSEGHAVLGGEGSGVAIPVSIGDTTGKGIVAYDFTLEYDPSVMRPAAGAIDTAGTLSEGWTVVHNEAEPGRVKVTAFSTNDLVGKGVLLNLRFDVLQGGRFEADKLRWADLQLNEGEVPVRFSSENNSKTGTQSALSFDWRNPAIANRNAFWGIVRN